MQASSADMHIERGGEHAWADLRRSLQASNVTDALVIVGGAEGTMVTALKGKNQSPSRVSGARALSEELVPLASATKWLIAATILRMVDGGLLSLEDFAHEHLDFWATDSADSRSKVRLKHLLSLTSGVGSRPVRCGGLLHDSVTNGDFMACAQQVHEVNANMTQAPAKGFYYSINHLVVAGAMALSAHRRHADLSSRTSVEDESRSDAWNGTAEKWSENQTEMNTLVENGTDKWQDLMRLYLREPLGMSDHAGSAEAQATPGFMSALVSPRDYGRFLQSMSPGGGFLSSRARREGFSDHTKTAHFNEQGRGTLEPWFGERWHYSFGHWIECLSAEACDTPSHDAVHSSVGALGFYPILVNPHLEDYRDSYFAIIVYKVRMPLCVCALIQSVHTQRPAETHASRSSCTRCL